MDTSKVTRFEVYDRTAPEGENFVRYGVNVQLALQDGGRTLKVFLTEGEPFVADMTEWNKSMAKMRSRR